MHLFLTSSCISPNLQEPFLEFLNKDPKLVKLFFVPTASDNDEEQFYTVKSINDIAAVGINPIWYALKYKTPEQIEHDLTDADVIWVNGGNTFHLLDVARKTGFLTIVDDLVRNKGVRYGGTSAGSILAASSIEIAGWGDDADENVVQIQDLAALNFTNILPQVHYNELEHKNMLSAHMTTNPIYAIPDGSAVEIQDSKILTHGKVEIFTK